MRSFSSRSVSRSRPSCFHRRDSGFELPDPFFGGFLSVLCRWGHETPHWESGRRPAIAVPIGGVNVAGWFTSPPASLGRLRVRESGLSRKSAKHFGVWKVPRGCVPATSVPSTPRTGRRHSAGPPRIPSAVARKPWPPQAVVFSLRPCSSCPPVVTTFSAGDNREVDASEQINRKVCRTGQRIVESIRKGADGGAAILSAWPS